MNGVIRGGRYLENIMRYYRCAFRFQRDRGYRVDGQNPAQIGFLCEWCIKGRKVC